jgi:membrane protein implicated in regulation of membrane protease activity
LNRAGNLIGYPMPPKALAYAGPRSFREPIAGGVPRLAGVTGKSPTQFGILAIDANQTPVATGAGISWGCYMPWWAWLVMGIGLLGVEMVGIDAQFDLGVIGASAAIVGLIGLTGITTPEWAQWLIFALLSIVTMVAFRRRIYELVRARSGHVEERLTVGDRVTVPVRLEPGQTCRVDYRGSSWTARNIDQLAIEAGREALISQVDGLTLQLKAG